MTRRSRSAARLPTGTVTFLFTDIEGSTRLLRELGNAYESMLARHAAILRQAISSHDGIEVGTEGDAFFAVFTSPLDALEAAVEAQRGLDAEPWSGGATLRVRMGMHTGEGRLGGDDYMGMDVHRAARIAAAAHGGQVLLSESVRSLVDGKLPGGLAVRDLGRYQLKDLPQPERLYQLEGPGLDKEFPPIRRPTDTESHLPARKTSIVGRALELAEIERLLEQNRLLTLTGAGGSGKTTLALEIALRRAGSTDDGAWFVDLAGVREPADVRAEIARGLGLRDGAIGPASERLMGFVADRELFIVLDNFEQVIDAAGEVTALIEGSTRSSVLVTSRMPLRLAAEQEYPVRPLGLASDGGDTGADAVALFVARAKRVRPDLQLDAVDLEVVEDICRLLDGLPLAIELAAARVSALPLGMIRDRLVARLPLPGSGPRDLPARQRTVDDTVDWSRDLLTPAMQSLFDRLAVFELSFDLEQVEQVIAGPDGPEGHALSGLYELVERSLVSHVPDEVGGVRFGILGTVRARARSYLSASGEEADLQERHAHAYADLAERAAGHIPGAEQAYWLDRLGADEANLRTAAGFAIAAGDSHTASVLVGHIWRWWLAVGRLTEARDLVAQALSLPGAEAGTTDRLRLLEAAGGVAYWSGDLTATLSFYEERTSLADGIGAASEQGQAWLDLYYARIYAGDTERAQDAIETARSRFTDADDEAGLSRAEGAQDTTLLLAAISDLSTVRAEVEATARRRMSSKDPPLRRVGHVLLGVMHLLEGDADDALKMAAAALRHDMAVRDSAEAILDLQGMGAALRLASRSEEAAVIEGAVEAAVERYGVRPVFADLLEQTLLANRGADPVAELGPSRYEDAVGRGRRMSLTEAAEFAAQLVSAPTTEEGAVPGVTPASSSRTAR